MKMIEIAIEKGELHLFLMGEGGYKCHGRSDYPEPTDYLCCWEEEIIPYFNIYNNGKMSENLNNSILMLFNYTKDVNLGIYSAVRHVFLYHYFKKNGKIKFNIDEDTLLGKLQEIVKKDREHLANDTRWAGTEWNSSQGLYEPICRMLTKLLPNMTM